MAKFTATALGGLQKEIMRRAKKSMETEVADYVKGKVKRHVETDVYNKYSPKVYKRREEIGGLVDDGNLRSEYRAQDRTLYVYEEAPIEGPRLDPGENWKYYPDSLAQIIQEGAHNPWNTYGYPWTEPRPFMDNTQEDIEEHPTKILNMLKTSIEGTKDKK